MTVKSDIIDYGIVVSVAVVSVIVKSYIIDFGRIINFLRSLCNDRYGLSESECMWIRLCMWIGICVYHASGWLKRSIP